VENEEHIPLTDRKHMNNDPPGSVETVVLVDESSILSSDNINSQALSVDITDQILEQFKASSSAY